MPFRDLKISPNLNQDGLFLGTIAVNQWIKVAFKQL